MAQEVVVKDQLTESMVALGKLLTNRLLAANLDLVCAMWFYDPESNQWRFVLSSPQVDDRGPLHVYQVAQEILRNAEFKGSGLKLQNMSAVTPTDSLIRAVRAAFKVDGGLAEIRLTRNRINDVFVEDALVLFLR